MISLDGVMQAPGGPAEDKSGGFKYGGWTMPFSDDALNDVLEKEMLPADYLLGRKTFDIWVDYWPKHHDVWPGINEGTKYVLSKRLKKTDPRVVGWKNTVVIRTVSEIRKLKASEGADIHVWGSSEVVQLLLKNNLVDELRLKIYPITLGKGKKLFGNGVIPAAFALTESAVTPSGVIIAAYKRNGDVKTGTVVI